MNWQLPQGTEVILKLAVAETSLGNSVGPLMAQAQTEPPLQNPRKRVFRLTYADGETD
jgi:hypothetical protein